MIVYAQTSQRVPVIMEKIQVASDYSKVNNKEFHVIVDKDVYWGLSWYLRGFENIQYEDFSYIEVALDGSPIQSPESSVLLLSEYNEGNLFARLGNYSMAIDYFKKAVENDMEELDYKVNLAVALYRMYKYDEAMGYYEEVKKAKPELVTQLDFIESMGENTPKFNKFD